MTMMPIIRYNGPYYTPPSSMAWLIRDCMQHALGTVLSFTVPRHGSLQTWICLRFLKRHYDYQVSWGVLKAAEETASVQSLKIDLGIFHWTLGSLSRACEDDILERFFEAIPGFFNFQMVTDIQRHHFPHMFRSQSVDSLCTFLDVTCYQALSLNRRRLVGCMNATRKYAIPMISIESFPTSPACPSIKYRHQLRRRTFFPTGVISVTVVFLGVHENYLPESFCMCRNAMTVGLRSPGTNLTYQSMFFGTVLPTVTIACCWQF